MFYYKKASFDTSQRPNIKASEIFEIKNGDGGWTWDGKKYDFYREYSIDLNRKEIAQICSIVNSSKAKYIDQIRPTEWFDINLKKIDSTEIIITVKRNDDEGVFFEINHIGYVNAELDKFIKSQVKKNDTAANSGFAP